MRPTAAKPLSDAELLARVRRGDAGAQQSLFERHRGALEGRIRRLLPRAARRRVSVADVVQETRILAFGETAQFEDRGEGAYRAWLLAIAERKAREALRAHVGTAKRALGREVSGTGRVVSRLGVAPGASPSEAALASERKEAVARTLATLAPDDQQVLRLGRLEGRPLREVAERMGRSLDAVKKLYGRALVRFGKAFDAGGGPRP